MARSASYLGYSGISSHNVSKNYETFLEKELEPMAKEFGYIDATKKRIFGRKFFHHFSPADFDIDVKIDYALGRELPELTFLLSRCKKDFNPRTEKEYGPQISMMTYLKYNAIETTIVYINGEYSQIDPEKADANFSEYPSLKKGFKKESDFVRSCLEKFDSMEFV